MHTQTLLEPHARAGVTDLLRALLAPALLYAEARFRIARLEGKEALQVGLVVGGLVIAILLCLAVAYVSGIVALALWISQNWWQGSLFPAALVMIGGHLVLASSCVFWLVRTLRSHDLFHITRREFMEDKRWLQTHPTSRN
jgi:uncharacterized membrane protein YqjE